ncbi:MAG: serine/threonine protein kinase [Gallionellales bacterium GWA2_60_18]|nr:MAG: serine/threonine protein kinase [Gallionellales bacterium GWA2_60_18]
MAEQKIGRFEIVGELGKGGQGAVYLAHDPQLGRQVAIKTLRNLGRDTERLLHEARIVSKLQHPNIVALYDAGEYQGSPYLVYAYIEGQTLAQKLKRGNTLSFVEAAEITCGVLDGLSYAHAQGVMHLDIKPANVMLGSNGMPMVMDFGLAQATGEQGQAAANAVDGTPHYMAPERISGKPADILSDIYSVGVMLYEMVTGELAFDGESVYAVLNRAAHEDVIAPSERNERVDEDMEVIILKAIARKSEERYQNAAAMKQALQVYLGNARKTDGGVEQKAHSTLEFLLRRMRNKSDFPALSNVISEINRIVSSDSESPARLARVILQDFALTNKVLRLVNTVSYGQFGGSINTISKAVMIMGFDTIRNIAMTLILLEFMKNKSQSAQLKDEVVAAILSGIVAAQLSVGKNIRDAEEAMVCSMFHNLGRILATFYFFEESQEVLRLVEQGTSEEHAAIKVLGISYPELGSGVAKTWNFSPRLLAGMRKLPGEKISAPHSDLDHLAVTVNMANELCAVAASASEENKEQALRELSERYRGAIAVSDHEMNNALDRGLDEMTRRSAIFGISPSKSALLRKVQKWSGYAQEADREEQPKQPEPDGVTTLDQVVEQQAEGKEDLSVRSPEDVLGAGIQDVTTSLVGEFNLSELLQMVLETMYRGMGFNRALIMIRDNKQNAMTARLGFGADIEAVIPRFRFTIASTSDVFQLSVSKGADILIENTHAPNIIDKIPAWYRSSVNAPCFMLLPVMVKDKAIALFYADMLEASSLNISKQQLSLLRTLRNQAVLAIKQKV